MHTIHQGHVLDVLKRMPDRSVHCIVTSPPYFQLREYGGPDHYWPDGKRGKLGEESTLDKYVFRLHAIFEQLYRVLRRDGTFFFNIGETHKNGIPMGVPEALADALDDCGFWLKSTMVWIKGVSGRINDDDDWVGAVMPESVDGWRWSQHKIRRNDEETREYEAKLQAEMKRTGKDRNSAAIKLAKVRPALMVDCPGCPQCEAHDGLILKRGAWRPTHAFEYIFMLTKGAKEYYCDRDGAAAEHIYGEKGGACIGKVDQKCPECDGTGQTQFVHGRMDDGGPKMYVGCLKCNGTGLAAKAAGQGARRMDPTQRAHKGGRNLRNVLAVPTKGYKGAHFATYPEALIEPIIAAGCPAYVCGVCDTPFARVEATSGFKPTCDCTDFSGNHDPGGIVLDPFLGSGTTLAVAHRLGRRGIGIEACPEYAQLAKERLKECPLVVYSSSDGETQSPLVPSGKT